MTDEEIEAMFTPGPPCSQLLGWRLLAHDEARGWIKVGFVGAAEFLIRPAVCIKRVDGVGPQKVSLRLRRDGRPSGSST